MDCFAKVIQWFGSESAAHFGELLTGIAGIGALLVATTALPNEIRKWRMQERLKRKSEIAGKTLVSTIRFVEALLYIVNPISMGRTVEQQAKPKDPIKDMRQTFYGKIESAQADMNAFLSAWTEAEVFLSKEVHETLDEIWKTWNSIRANFETWTVCLAQEAEAKTIVEFYQGVYGKGPKTKLNELRDRLKAQLLPFARMERDE